MKLQTTIPPRADGTVIARIDASTAYKFVGNPPEFDVTNEAHAVFLLKTGNFISAEPVKVQDDEPKVPSVPKPDEDPGYEVQTLDVGDDDPAELEAFDIATADAKALREFIKAKTGSAPAPATGLDKLRAIAETVAD